MTENDVKMIPKKRHKMILRIMFKVKFRMMPKSIFKKNKKR